MTSGGKRAGAGAKRKLGGPSAPTPWRTRTTLIDVVRAQAERIGEPAALVAERALLVGLGNGLLDALISARADEWERDPPADEAAWIAEAWSADGEPRTLAEYRTAMRKELRARKKT